MVVNNLFSLNVVNGNFFTESCRPLNLVTDDMDVPSIFTNDMSEEEMKTTTFYWLRDLINNKILMRSEDNPEIDLDLFTLARANRPATGGMGNVFILQYLDRAIEKLNLKHIKTSKFCLVMVPNISQLYFSIFTAESARDGRLCLGMKKSNSFVSRSVVDLFVEKLATERLPTLEEMQEFFELQYALVDDGIDFDRPSSSSEKHPATTFKIFRHEIL